MIQKMVTGLVGQIFVLPKLSTSKKKMGVILELAFDNQVLLKLF